MKKYLWLVLVLIAGMVGALLRRALHLPEYLAMPLSIGAIMLALFPICETVDAQGYFCQVGHRRSGGHSFNRAHL